jgi:hypothetical protein
MLNLLSSPALLAHAGPCWPSGQSNASKAIWCEAGDKALLWALHGAALQISPMVQWSTFIILHHKISWATFHYGCLATARHKLGVGCAPVVDRGDGCLFFCGAFSNRFKTKKVCNHWCDVTCTALAFTCPGRAESTVQMSQQGSEIVSPPASGAHDPNSFGRRWDLVGADLEHDIGALRHMSHGEGADVSG